MDSFLAQVKGSLGDLSGDDQLHVVLGNESCDLDSIVCSLVYAYYLRKADPSTVIVPVLDCSPDALDLRREVVTLFNHLGLSISLLTYAGDIDLLRLHGDRRLKLTLVDHNSLSSKWKALQPAVVEIIDHHKDSQDASSRVQKTVEMVGSCATLVGEKLLSLDVTSVSEEVATLLLAAVLLDTINLDAAAGRTTEKDREVANLLGEIAGQETGSKVFEMLRRVKFDVSGLSTADLLVKDYKSIDLFSASEMKVGISSVTCSFEDLLARDDVQDAFNDFLEQNKVNCLVVMTIYISESSSQAKREIGVYCADRHSSAEIVSALQADDVLQLERISPSIAIDDLVIFSQGNCAASRKIVLPLLACALTVGNVGTIGNSRSASSSYVTDTSALLPVTQVDSGTLSDNLQAESGSGRSPTPITEYSAQDEAHEERSYRSVGVEGVGDTIDLKAIESYRRVVSHGGYQSGNTNAIIVLSGQYMPNKSIKDYTYVMEHLFRYVISFVQRLAVSEYCIVLFNSTANRNNTPGINWLRKYYNGIDRQLRKNLQNLYIYRPTMRVKVVLQLARPFISSKFWRKVTYVDNLLQLKDSLPLAGIDVPEEIRLADRTTGSVSQSEASHSAATPTSAPSSPLSDHMPANESNCAFKEGV